MSHHNRHHHPRGTIRPRSPEVASSIEPTNPSTGISSQTTKSPTSDRPTKKGRTLGDNPAPPLPRHEPPLVPKTTAKGPAPRTMPTPTQTPTQPVQTLMEALISQLESLSQTISTLLTHYPDLAGLDSSRVKQAIDTITTLHKPANTQTKKPHTTANPPGSRTKSYAAAAASTTEQPEKKHTKPGMASLAQPFHPVESKRLIVDFFGSPGKRQPPVLEIRDRVNTLFDDWTIPCKVFAAKYTKSENVVLSISPPSSARLLMNNPIFQDPFVAHLKNIFNVPDDAQFSVYPDEKWHRIVIHKVPTKNGSRPPGDDDTAILESMMADWTEYNSMAYGIPRAALSRLRFLTPPDATLASLNSVSICVAIPDAKQARRLLKEGAYFFGEHCRTSIYVPRHH